ncbi:peptidyl-prolyl cis-trans isomerase, partial [Lichtheimia hyalospora FSU 10163]
ENCKRTVGSNAKITLHFKARAWGEDEYFEDTYKNNAPLTYKLGKRLKNGVQGMCEGEIRRVLMPADLAFGELGLPGKVPPNTAVVYDIEVIKVNAPFT